MIDFQKLLDPQYWLNPQPGYQFQWFWPLLVAFVLCFVAGIVLTATKKWYTRIWTDKIALWLRWLGVGGLLLIFLRYQGLKYLSLRIYFLILGVGFLLWLVWITNNLRQLGPELEKQAERQETFEKYLPRKKLHRRQ